MILSWLGYGPRDVPSFADVVSRTLFRAANLLSQTQIQNKKAIGYEILGTWNCPQPWPLRSRFVMKCLWATSTVLYQITHQTRRGEHWSRARHPLIICVRLGLHARRNGWSGCHTTYALAHSDGRLSESMDCTSPLT